MAYSYPYQQPTYFNTNYVPPMPQPSVQQMPQMQPVPQVAASPTITPVPDELTARGAQFPMDGSVIYFLNSQSGEIYTKQLNMIDGSVIFHVYRKVQPERQAQTYATHEDMQKLREEIYKMIGEATSPAGGADK